MDWPISHQISHAQWARLITSFCWFLIWITFNPENESHILLQNIRLSPNYNPEDALFFIPGTQLLALYFLGPF
jgi:hypothetical protein